jgi:hypothetical protein
MKCIQSSIFESFLSQTTSSLLVLHVCISCCTHVVYHTPMSVHVVSYSYELLPVRHRLRIITFLFLTLMAGQTFYSRYYGFDIITSARAEILVKRWRRREMATSFYVPLRFCYVIWRHLPAKRYGMGICQLANQCIFRNPDVTFIFVAAVSQTQQTIVVVR